MVVVVVVVLVVVIDGCGDDVDDDVGGIHIVDHHRWGQVGRVEWDAMVAQVQEMSAQQRQLANLITSSCALSRCSSSSTCRASRAARAATSASTSTPT